MNNNPNVLTMKNSNPKPVQENISSDPSPETSADHWAFIQGFTAYGHNAYNNPYVSGTTCHRSWEDGWNDAEKADLSNRG